MGNEVRVKGQGFASFFGALQELRGEAVTAAVKQALPGEGGEALRLGSIVAVGWYPVAWYRELHAAAQRVTGEGPSLSEEIGRRETRRDVNGVYRVMFKLLSPQTLIAQSNRLLKVFLDPVRVTITEKGKGHVLVRYDELRGFDRNLWRDMFGGSLEVLSLAGAKDIDCRILSGGGDGDDFMETEGRWR